MRLPTAAEASTQALLQANETQVAHILQHNYFSRTASPSVSSRWERSTARPPINVDAFVHTRDCGGRRRSTATNCQAVMGTLEDATRALHADDTSSYRRVESALFGPDLLLDARVLASLVPRTKETPYNYVGLKHVKYRSLMDDRHAEEFLLLETAGKGVHPTSGAKFVFKVLRTVDAPEREFEMRSANSHHAHLQVHRGAIHALLLVLAETSHRGILKMQLWLDVELTKCAEPFYGAFSSLHDAFSLSIRYRQLIESFSTANGGELAVAASTGTSASKFGLLPSRSSRERKCQTCQRALGFFARKKNHLCTVCGLFVCSSCLTTTTFQNWRLCGLCFERNERLLDRTRVSKMSSLASGLGGTLHYLTRFTRSYSKQRDSILYATAEAAGELPPNPLQDVKQKPQESRTRTAGRTRVDDGYDSSEDDTKPLAKSVIGLRRVLGGGKKSPPTDLSASMGLGSSRGARSDASSSSLSKSQGPGGRKSGSLRRSLLYKADRKASYDPAQDMSNELRASLFDGTNGSFLATSKPSSTNLSNSNRVSTEQKREPTASEDNNSGSSSSSGSSRSTTSSGSGSSGPRASPPPVPVRESSKTQRAPPPLPPPSRPIRVASSHSSDRRSNSNGNARSRPNASHGNVPKPTTSWASASVGPGLSASALATSSSTGSARQKTKLVDQDALHGSRLSSTWRSSMSGDFTEPIPSIPESSEHLTLADLESPQSADRVYQWV